MLCTNVYKFRATSLAGSIRVDVHEGQWITNLITSENMLLVYDCSALLLCVMKDKFQHKHYSSHFQMRYLLNLCKKKKQI